MPDMCKLLDEVEKKLYIQGLAYVLGMNKQDPKQKKEYLLAQMAETGLSESEYKKIKCNCKTDALIKDLEQITDIRAKRYILREMILLAVADHELQDEEVEDLHKIGKGMGISEEKINDFFIWAARGIEWQLEGIKLVEEEETTKGGLILSGSAKEKPQVAEVIAVGPGGNVDGKEVEMIVKVGDKVLTSKYSGTEVKVDGEECTIVRQSDILAVVE